MIKVLLADDESHIRLLFKKILSKAAFNIVAEASNGIEAVDLYKQHKPDLVLMDIAMPHKTGTEALKEIIEYDSKACIIMLTSMVDIDTVKTCINSGAANYLRKDSPIDQIPALINETFNLHK